MRKILNYLFLFIAWLFFILLVLVSVGFYNYNPDPELWKDSHRGFVGISAIVVYLFMISSFILNNDKK